MEKQKVDAFIAHHGKKGMRWGIRNKQNPSESPKVSRQVRKAQERQAQFQKNQAKAADFLNTALKDPQVLIKLNGRTVVTGKEFTDHLIAGGLLDVNTTSIYAQQKTKNGPYVLTK